MKNTLTDNYLSIASIFIPTVVNIQRSKVINNDAKTKDLVKKYEVENKIKTPTSEYY